MGVLKKELAGVEAEHQEQLALGSAVDRLDSTL